MCPRSIPESEHQKKQRGDHLDPSIGILLSSGGFAARLAGEINSRRNVAMTAIAFNSPAELKEYVLNKRLKLLLSDDPEVKELVSGMCGFCLLSEDPLSESQVDGDTVFKYQSASALINSVISLNQEAVAASSHVYAVFSPTSNQASYEYAIRLAERLSKEGKTLLLSWDFFGGLGRESGEEPVKTISDLLYTARKNEAGLRKLLSSLPTVNGCDYFAGTDYYADLWQYSAEETERLLDDVRRYGGFASVVFLCGFFSPCLEELFTGCDEVYLVGVSGIDRRCDEFIRQMKYAGKQLLLSKIREVSL